MGFADDIAALPLLAAEACGSCAIASTLQRPPTSATQPTSATLSLRRRPSLAARRREFVSTMFFITSPEGEPAVAAIRRRPFQGNFHDGIVWRRQLN
jgi:hypothetical protein